MDLVRRGIRWRIGAGIDVDIWKDNWIPRQSSMKPFTPNLHSLEETSVSSLIDQENCRWDEDIVKSLFWEEDWHDILAIPLPAHAISDVRVWSGTKHGFFSIKSVYYMARKLRLQEFEIRLGTSNTNNQKNWSWVWGINVPNKIKIFFWRLIKDSLPTCEQLCRRGLNIANNCVVCGDENETIIHVFRDCNYARLFWAISPLSHYNLAADCSNLVQWIVEVRRRATTNDLEMFTVAYWSLWSNRNKKFHEDTTYDATESIRFAQQYILRYHEARTIFAEPRPPDIATGWIRPNEGCYKVNYDASVIRNPCRVGLGAVVQNWKGEILAWSTHVVDHIQSVEAAEALAAKLALTIANTLDIDHLEVEGDCQNLVKQLQQYDPSLLEAGTVIEDTKMLASSFNSCSFRFTRRCNNQLAHILAKLFAPNAGGTSVLPCQNPDVT